MKYNFILLFCLPMVLLISACASEPTLKSYIPKESVKIIYVAKDDIASTKKITAKDYLAPTKPSAPTPIANPAPTIEITGLTIDPDPVPVNQPFDFQVNFKADIPGSSDNKISTLLYFKISQNDKTLFNSEPYSIKADNGKIKIWKLHMNPVSAKGVYTIKVFVKFKELLSEKNLELTIQ